MQNIKKIGTVDWNLDEIKKSIPEFLELYRQKPSDINQGGMMSPHMFATWFMLKKLNPKNVIESGIWKGQGTWLIEKTLPNAKVYSIDVALQLREYISDKVTYFQKDFSKIDWSMIEEKESTLLFFDDHQNAFERIRLGKKLGFKKFIFEDNYPAKRGDCYSLKKAFQHAGFTPEKLAKKGIRATLRNFVNLSKKVQPGKKDADFLQRSLDIYYEFPPVFKNENTRWGDQWNEEDYPTQTPVYEKIEEDYLKVFKEEAMHYTWICYALLK